MNTIRSTKAGPAMYIHTATQTLMTSSDAACSDILSNPWLFCDVSTQLASLLIRCKL